MILFSKGEVSEFLGLDSGVEQLLKQLMKINWSEVNWLVLVLVKRARTARYLANYLSNCRELFPRLRGVRTTFIAGHGGGSAVQGKDSAINLFFASLEVFKLCGGGLFEEFCSDGLCWRFVARAEFGGRGGFCAPQ